MPRDEDFEQFLESFQRTGFIVINPNFASLTSKTNFCSIFDKKNWFSKHTSSGSKKDSLVYCKLYVTVWCILLSLVGIISSLFTLLNERVELNYCWACTNLVYHLKISAFSPSLEFYLFKKIFQEISPRNFTKKSQNFLVRELWLSLRTRSGQ